MAASEPSAFGVLLRRYRIEAGLTQEELAERAQVSARVIGDLERGVTQTPRQYTVRQIADALGLSDEERTRFKESTGTQPAIPSAPVAVAERSGQPSVIQAFLIADIRGYTSFTQEQGDEAAARLASRFAELAVEVVTPLGGEVLELRGDEAMVVFSSARQAIQVAVNLQQRFAQERERDSSMPLKVGIGLDTGEVVSVQGGYRGGALNRAARLCSLAGAGEVFASEAFVHLIGKTEGVVYIDRGGVHLKGLTEPVRVIQIAAEGELPSKLPPLEQELATHPTNLPDETTRFIGRERELSQVVDLLRQPGVRLVTLTGTGGTGKTRLALQVAGRLLPRFEDGVFFVPLAPLSDPELVLSTIADTLSIKEHPGTSLLAALTVSLRSKHLLLMLDNFEHLLDAASLVAELLDACRTLHVLVTSRIPLHLTREHECSVPPLSVPDLDHLSPLQQLAQVEAVALFLERARAAKASFGLTTENASAVGEICSRLDGLPLAIVLAAARIKLFPPRALLQRLSSRLTLLAGEARDLPARQRTLRGTIDWSYQLLAEREQRLFAWLSIFAGSWTLEGAEAVCNVDTELRVDVLNSLAALLDQSMVQQEQTAGDEARFSMLDTIREYAAERLEAKGETELIGHAHAAYYLALAERAASELMGRDQQLWREQLEEEHDNLRAALRWCLHCGQPEMGPRMVSALQRFWIEHMHWMEAQHWVEQVLRKAGNLDPTLHADALDLAASLAILHVDLQRGKSMFEESLRLRREVGDKERLARTLGLLGVLADEEGDLEKLRTVTEEMTGLYQELGNKAGVASSIGCSGYISMQAGDQERARELFEQSLALFRELTDKQAIAATLNNLASLVCEQGDYGRARMLLAESLSLLRELGSRTILLLYTVETVAGVAALDHAARDALLILGGLSAWRETIGAPLLPHHREPHQRVMDLARARLDEAAWGKTWEQGRAMSVEQVIAVAEGYVTKKNDGTG